MKDFNPERLHYFFSTAPEKLSREERNEFRALLNGRAILTVDQLREYHQDIYEEQEINKREVKELEERIGEYETEIEDLEKESETGEEELIEQIKDNLDFRLEIAEKGLIRTIYDEIRLTHGEDIADRLEPTIKEAIRRNPLYNVAEIVDNITEKRDTYDK